MAISAAWWTAWWEEDFSWDGLSQKPWEGWSVLPDGRLVETEALGEAGGGAGMREATLQDYWRMDPATERLRPLDEVEAELAASPVTAKRFTRVHLPLAWENGAPTGKADWDGDALDDLLRIRIAAANAKETRFDLWGAVDGPDRRAQLQGVVFGGFSVDRVSGAGRSADEEHEQFPLSIRCDGAAFAGRASFARAAFAGTASFARAAFAGTASFDRAAFAGTAWFDGAAFAGTAWFDGAAFAGIAWFARAAFAGDASFARAAFAGIAWFARAAFAGDARFSGLGAELQSEAREQLPTTRTAADGASYEGALRTPQALTPQSRRAFKSIEATGAVFLGEVRLENRDILEPSSFRDALFFGPAHFHGSALHQGVSFHGAEFERALEPDRVHPAPDAALAALYAVEARRREIKDEPAIAEAVWRDEFEAKRRRQASQFEAHGAVLSDEAEAEREKLPDAERAAQALRAQNSRYARLEDCFRTLKLAMETNRNRSEEARFFKLELKARRKRRERAVPFWERIMSDIYGGASDYGSDVLRPILWIVFALIPAFTVIYDLLYATLATLPERWITFNEGVEALTFSLARILPFGPWAAADAAGSVGGRLLDVGDDGFGPGVALLVRVLASLQSLIAIVLVFLAALAVRRRFQIS